MKLTQRIELVETDRDVLNDIAAKHHYLHRPVHQRSSPFGYMVKFDGLTVMPDGLPCGFIIFASIHFTKQRNLFGYDGLPTKWQVLSLARLWLHDELPRNSETVVISKAIQPKGLERISRVGMDWLRTHPPRFPEEPYHVRLIVSYADNTVGHEGTIYKAANFEGLVQCQSCNATFYSVAKPALDCPHCGQKTTWNTFQIVSEARHKNTRGTGFADHILTQYVYRLPEPQLTIADVPGLQLFLPFPQPSFQGYQPRTPLDAPTALTLYGK